MLLNRLPDSVVDPVKYQVSHSVSTQIDDPSSIHILCSYLGSYDTQGRCNTFAIGETDVYKRRSNERHDELVLVLEKNGIELADFIRKGSRGREKLEKQHRLAEKGIRGPCVLRPLTYFDVGKSFLIDSLHNVYLGAFVSTIFCEVIDE